MERPQDLQKTLGLFQLLAFGVAGLLGASWIYTNSALFAEYGAAGVRWHTPTGLGFAVFGNRTYFPAEDVAEPVLDDMVRQIGYQPRDPGRKLRSTPYSKDLIPRSKATSPGFSSSPNGGTNSLRAKFSVPMSFRTTPRSI